MAASKGRKKEERKDEKPVLEKKNIIPRKQKKNLRKRSLYYLEMGKNLNMKQE